MSQEAIGIRIVNLLFVVAWLFPVIVIVGYYVRVVGARWREVERTFFDGNLAPSQFRESLERHPGARYLPPHGGKVTEKSIRDAVREEFARIHSPRRYLIPLLLLVVISGCGLWLCHAWVCQRWFPPSVPSPNEFPNTISESVIMALAGAYAWGIYEIVERVRERTLTPSEIRELCFRWLVSIPIGYSFSMLATESIKPMFAFAASAFPLKDIKRLLRENGLKKLGQGGDKTAPNEQRLHLTISGVSDVMASRLEELNVYTVLDMAYASPIQLMVKTGVPIRSVIDWMDQALFHVYSTSDQRDVLHGKFGIRCSIDVCEFLNLHGKTEDASFHALATALSMAPKSLSEFLFRIYDDPQVHCMYHLWYPRGALRQLGGDRELESKAA